MHVKNRTSRPFSHEKPDIAIKAIASEHFRPDVFEFEHFMFRSRTINFLIIVDNMACARA